MMYIGRHSGLRVDSAPPLAEEVNIMKKLLLSLFMLVMLGAVGYGLYLYAWAPHQVFCTRFVQLCEIEAPEVMTACTDTLAGAVEGEGEGMRRAATCAVEADTCQDATMCLVEAGTSIGLRELAPLLKGTKGIVEDFVDGLKSGADKLFE
jgi:hypothetical protein